jgi:hypothetical protein
LFLNLKLSDFKAMSRTYRNSNHNHYYRHPKTTNEIRQNTALLSDLKSGDFDYDISGLNRLHRYIPNAWDDIVISSYSEGKKVDIHKM